MMKIILLILLSTCTLLNAEYSRYRTRNQNPPHRRRSPPSQQFSKKWHQGGPLIQGIPQGIPHGLPQGIPQGMPQGIPQGMPQGIPQGLLLGIPQGFPHGVPQGLPHGVPHKNPQGNSQFSLRGPPVRQRPMNHNHVPMLLAAPNHKVSNKVPVGLPLMVQRPSTPPVRNVWKNPVNSVQFPPEKPFKQHTPSPPVEQQKPFRSAPSSPIQDFDYHLQTNQIPHSHINPIKQIGEKGPIHTIPAPNLSLKDKPIIADEVRNDLSFQHNSHHDIRNDLNFQNNLPHDTRHEISFGQKIPQSTYVTIQKSHEYQVTEPPESSQKLYKAQQEHQKQIQLQIQKQIEQMQKQAEQDSQNHQILLASDSIPIQHSLEQNPSGDIILSNNLSPKDLYQLVSATYPQPQQGQSQNIQLFQPDGSFLEQFPQESIQIASDKISFQPEYQSFNYDEQAHQKSLSKKDMSSLVSAAYNLGTDDKEISSRNSEDPLTQAELVQNYFDNRSDVAENKIEPDVKSSNKKTALDETLAGTSYFSSLPNKEAADRLAQLQNAGKINSNLMKLLSSSSTDSKEPMTILIPDDYDNDEDIKKDASREEKGQSNDYDEYSQEENIPSKESEEFGHRIQPKKRAE